MKRFCYINILLLVTVLFTNCKKETQVNTQTETQKTAQSIPKLYKTSHLRIGENIEVGAVYTDTVQFVEFNDNYDDFLFIVKKDNESVALIYNQKNPEFLKDERLEIKWKMDSMRPAGDPEFLDFVEHLVSAKSLGKIPNFENEFTQLPLKTLPLTEETSFDSFSEIQNTNPINAEAFKLPLIYSNWYKTGYNFKLSSGYRLDYSKDFYTTVLTVKKGDHEMETTLINYNLDGQIIDYKIIAYDEIAEGFFKTTSKLEKDKITIKNIEWTDEGHESSDVFKITSEGKIKIITNKELIISNAISQLNLDPENLKEELISSQFLKHNNETIIVLPEIVEEAEEFFTLNTHIVIYKNDTNQITHTYFESYKTNTWVSDAIRLDQLAIDAVPYPIDKSTKAFGVRVHYFGSSRVNPYYHQTLSLFVKNEQSLKKILSNFSLEENTGEWNGSCEGEFNNQKNTLSISEKMTNGYFDFEVKQTLTHTTNFVSDIGDCDEKTTEKTEQYTLKFNGSIYQKKS